MSYTTQEIFLKQFIQYLTDNNVFSFYYEDGVTPITINDIAFRYGNQNNYIQVGDATNKHLIAIYYTNIKQLSKQQVVYENIVNFTPLENKTGLENAPKIANNIALETFVSISYKISVLALDGSDTNSETILRGMINGINYINQDARADYTAFTNHNIIVDQIFFNNTIILLDFYKNTDSSKYQLQANTDMNVSVTLRQKFNKQVQFVNEIKTNINLTN